MFISPRLLSLVLLHRSHGPRAEQWQLQFKLLLTFPITRLLLLRVSGRRRPSTRGARINAEGRPLSRFVIANRGFIYYTSPLAPVRKLANEGQSQGRASDSIKASATRSEADRLTGDSHSSSNQSESQERQSELELELERQYK